MRQFLGRQAVVISGTVTDPDYAKKISSDSFEMTVDMETGVLLDFKGFSGGELTQHIEIKIYASSLPARITAYASPRRKR